MNLSRIYEVLHGASINPITAIPVYWVFREHHYDHQSFQDNSISIYLQRGGLSTQQKFLLHTSLDNLLSFKIWLQIYCCLTVVNACQNANITPPPPSTHHHYRWGLIVPPYLASFSQFYSPNLLWSNPLNPPYLLYYWLPVILRNNDKNDYFCSTNQHDTPSMTSNWHPIPEFCS